MASELQYQKYLVDATEALGGYAFKMSNRFLAGIPDLFIQLPGRPTLIVEVKKWDSLPKIGTAQVKVGLTALQCRALIDMSKAGTKCGWLAIYRSGTTDCIYAHPDPNHIPTADEVFTTAVIRKRGTPWTEVLLPALDPLYRSI